MIMWNFGYPSQPAWPGQKIIDMPNKSDSRVPYTRWEAVNEGDEEDDESGGSPIQVGSL